MNDLVNKATDTAKAGDGKKGMDDKEFNDLFSQALAQVFYANKTFQDNLGINQLKEMMDDIIKK